jgi:hypothetical protein
MGEERNQVVDEEVRKLKEFNFIKEIKYPQLTCECSVKKSNFKWRMCVDFTDSTQHAQKILTFLA